MKKQLQKIFFLFFLWLVYIDRKSKQKPSVPQASKIKNFFGGSPVRKQIWIPRSLRLLNYAYRKYPTR